MFHKYIKIVIALAITTWAGFQFADGHIMNGISLLFLAGIFVFFYFKNEFILLAFLQLRKQNLEGTKKWLDYIKNPSGALIKKQEGYYNFLQGIIVSQSNLTLAEKYFKKALTLGLSMGHDEAMAKLQLAGIAMSKNRKNEATKLISEAKKLDKHGMLKQQIKDMKNQMKKAPGMNHHQMRGRTRR
ncbi:MAG: DUF2892 domain-containing protein [Flavobacteriaceae bacterium]|nr:DUF2892 domain-containing protein [Flavobacteriaceae bacterium]